MATAEFTNTVLYPHPILASDDDAEYIRVTIARLPSLYDAFFHDVTMMAVAEEQLKYARQGGMIANLGSPTNTGPYLRGIGNHPMLMNSNAGNDVSSAIGNGPLPLGGDTATIATNNNLGDPIVDHETRARIDSSRFRLRAENLFAEIQRHMKMISSIPPGALRNAMDGTENVELRQGLSKLAYLWSGDVIKVNEKAANSWSKTVQKMAEDAVRLLEATHIVFPYRAQMRRRLTTPTSLTVIFLQPILVVSTIATVVSAVGFTTAGVPQHVTNYCVCICGGISLISMAIVVIGYHLSMEGLRDLFETVFISKFSGVEFKAAAAMEDLYQRQKQSEQLQQLAFTSGNNAMKKRNSNSGPQPLMLLGQSDLSGGNPTSPPQLISNQTTMAAARGAYYPLNFAGSTAFLDSRFIDAQLVMIGFDQTFKVTLWNVAAEAATGFLESEALGKPLSDLLETPDIEITDLISQNSNVGVIRILLKAFATSSIPMYTVVAPIINERTVLAGQSLAAATAGNGIVGGNTFGMNNIGGNVGSGGNGMNAAGGSGSGVVNNGNMDSPTMAAAQQRAPLGFVLICATGRDNLQDSKVYINSYWRFQIAHSLQSTIANGSFSPKDNSALTSLSDFVRKGTAKALEDTAHSMVFEWEWTTAEQVLARSLNTHMTRCTVRPPDRYFPSSICVNMGVIPVIDEIVKKVIRSARCHIELDLIQERTSKVSVFVVIIKLVGDGVSDGEGQQAPQLTQSTGQGPGARFRNQRMMSTSSTIGGANILSTKFGVLTLAAPTGHTILSTGGVPQTPTGEGSGNPVAFSQTLEALPVPRQSFLTEDYNSHHGNNANNNATNTSTLSGTEYSGSALSGVKKGAGLWSVAENSVLRAEAADEGLPVAIRGGGEGADEVASSSNANISGGGSEGQHGVAAAPPPDNGTLLLKPPGSNSASNLVSPTASAKQPLAVTGMLSGSGVIPAQTLPSPNSNGSHQFNNVEVSSGHGSGVGSNSGVGSGVGVATTANLMLSGGSHGTYVSVPPANSLPSLHQKPPYTSPSAAPSRLTMNTSKGSYSTSIGGGVGGFGGVTNIMSPPLPPPFPPLNGMTNANISNININNNNSAVVTVGTKSFNPTDILDPNGKVAGILASMLGMVKFLNNNTTVQILVPCQTAQQQYGTVSASDGGSSDTNNFATSTTGMPHNTILGAGSSLTTVPANIVGNEEFAVSTIYGSQGIALPAAPPISSTVNVMTMIGNLVDQHNLSMVLLKTMFVSLTNIREAKDLEKKLKATPCEVDVIVADKSTLHDARTLVAEYHRSKLGTAQSQSIVYLVPLLDAGAAVGTASPYVFRTPIDRNAINATMLEIGHLVSTRKQQQEQREEQERILASRQDSPWTRGKLLGRGAFGAVYEAVSDLTGGKMAVKMFYFKKDDANAEQTINIMLREIKIMCELNHPNIVHYFYCERQQSNGTTNSQNSLNLFMEICDGSLADLVMGVTANGGSKKVPTVADATSPDELRIAKAIANLTVNGIIAQVAKALVYLHDRGITHRDIKPQNILLKGEVVKMTDFGTARQNLNEDLTDVQGTFRYMAPEVYKGEPHSRSCDIWSLGCLTAELLGYPLKFMEKRFSYLLGEMTDVPLPAQLKGEGRDFVAKCLQVNPNQRIQTTMLSMHPFLSSGTEVQALLHFSDAHNRPGKRTSITSKMSAFSISSQSTANRLPAKRM